MKERSNAIMTLSDFVSGLFSDASSSADAAGEARSTDRGGDVLTVVYECRQCGTTVAADAYRCPTCERAGIAEYPVE
ncbi:hypothetical protein [Halovivax sp.]|uniref:hypothetical protein n=1 Tax=Halovivax sp. TaxID=1935978 RepID=UPI0025B980C5|nr:hypothetical protein [Halovivax sp.]